MNNKLIQHVGFPLFKTCRAGSYQFLDSECQNYAFDKRETITDIVENVSLQKFPYSLFSITDVWRCVTGVHVVVRRVIGGELDTI